MSVKCFRHAGPAGSGQARDDPPSRGAALFALAGQIPAPVLANPVGITDATAVHSAKLAARDWSNYIARRIHRGG